MAKEFVEELSKKDKKYQDIYKLQKQYKIKSQELLNAFTKYLRKNRYSLSKSDTDKLSEDFRVKIALLSKDLGSKIIKKLDLKLDNKVVEKTISRFAVKLGSKGKLGYKNKRLVKSFAKEIVFGFCLDFSVHYRDK